MRYTTGEVTGLAAIILAIAAVGTGMTFADKTPHLGERAPDYLAGSRETVAPETAALAPELATAGADYARPASPATPETPAIASPEPAPAPSVLVIRHILPIRGAIRYGDWHWDESAAPATGTIVITVDLEARVLSMFRDGYEIGTAAVLLGTQEKPTPTGVFPITQKDRDHVSNLYDAPMPYMMRLTDDGVTIHATNVQNGYASHGCIGVPRAFAKLLFEHAKLGDRVIITRGRHAALGDRLT